MNKVNFKGMQRHLYSHKMLAIEVIKSGVFIANYTQKVMDCFGVTGWICLENKEILHPDLRNYLIKIDGGLEMKDKWKRFKVWALIMCFCMMLLGVLMLIWPEISAVLVCSILGAVCIVTGVCQVVRYFKLGFAGFFFRFDLTLGICGILAGLLLLLYPMGAAALLPFAVGLYILTGSVFNIQASVEMKRFGIGNWVLSLILGIVSTVFAFCLILNPFVGVKALMIFVGISLVVGGIQSLYTVHCISQAVSAFEKKSTIDVS